MIIASNLAGKAINISKTTLPHRSYPFTNLFNISHGKAVSLFLRIFLFNYKNISKSKSKFNLNDRFDNFKLLNQIILKVLLIFIF